MIELSGIAHIALVVGEWERSRPFYRSLLSFLGLQPVFDGDEGLYYVGGRTAVGVQRQRGDRSAERFEQGSIGLHHFCFRARSRDDVDAVQHFLETADARIVRAAEEGPWAPGYYSLLFEDPSGIRIEINHVPGKGVLEEGARFEPGGSYS